MIHLINTSKSYKTPFGMRTVIRPTTLSIPVHRRIGILGRNGAGKSTLINMIAGVEKPSDGMVVRTCSVSWPLGFSGGLHPELSGEENVIFVSRIYNTDSAAALDFVKEFSELGQYLYSPVKTYSTGMKARLAFGMSLAVDFDCYLVDEITGVGDARFQRKSRKAFLARQERSGMLFVSHNENSVRQYCEMAIVIYDGHLVPFESLDEAIAFYQDTSNLEIQAATPSRLRA